MPLELLRCTTITFGRFWTWVKVKVGFSTVVDSSGWEPLICFSRGDCDVTEVVVVLSMLLVECWGCGGSGGSGG